MLYKFKKHGILFLTAVHLRSLCKQLKFFAYERENPQENH